MTTPLPIPVALSLLVAEHEESREIAVTEDDLHCRVVMMTGVQWLDCRAQYQHWLTRRQDCTWPYTVVNSFEKWGNFQEERLAVAVRMATA